jgi:alanine dehydrogenase
VPRNVLVLGAGSTGSSAAEAARRAGADVTVLRRATATPEAIERHALEAELVVGAAFVAGEPTPKLLPRALVRRMKRGAMIVDVSIEEGGVSETSRRTTHEAPTYVEEGVIHTASQHALGAPTRAPPFRKLPSALDIGRFGIGGAVKGMRAAL